METHHHHHHNLGLLGNSNNNAQAHHGSLWSWMDLTALRPSYLINLAPRPMSHVCRSKISMNCMADTIVIGL
jgi:hypothetical protein